MTTRQIELARHAIGLPNKMRMSYRNSFVTGVGHDDYAEWEQMVTNGDAEERDGKSLPYAGDSLFWLTVRGARQALNPREYLDPEDFTPQNNGRIKSRISDGPPLPRRAT
jgi:hypothetical protein